MLFLDIFFTIAHVVVITFNLFGWIWKKTRKAHLIVVMLTVASWLIIGIWKGIGYCFLTDWHWIVKEKLGETNLPSSFIKYAADNLSGHNFDAKLVDIITACVFIAIILVTVYVNFISKKKLIGDENIYY